MRNDNRWDPVAMDALYSMPEILKRQYCTQPHIWAVEKFSARKRQGISSVIDLLEQR